MITDGDVVVAVGVVDAVDVGEAVGVAETGVCVVEGAVSGVIAGAAVIVDAAADGDGDGDGLPLVSVWLV